MKSLANKEPIFFKGFSLNDKRMMLEDSRERVYGPGDFIFKEGQKATHFYLLLSGHVAIKLCSSTGERVKLQVLANENILGWSWLLPPHVWKFDALAQDTCHVLVFDGKKLSQWAEKNHEFGYELYKKLSKTYTLRLRSARSKIMELSHHPKNRPPPELKPLF